MKAILDVSVLVRFLRACLLLTLVLFSSAPAYCEELKAEQVIARCQSKLTNQEAVMLPIYADDRFVVIAARDKKLEGEVVTLKHIIGKNEDERRYVFCKEGTNTPVLTMPYYQDDLSLDEALALKSYYAKKGKNTISITSSRTDKGFHPIMSRKAQRK